MGCGASAKAKYKVGGKSDGADIMKDSEYLFRTDTPDYPYRVKAAQCNDQLCKVTNIDNSSWPFTVVFTTGDVGGKEQGCLSKDLHPIPSDYKRAPMPTPAPAQAATAAIKEAPATTPAAAAAPKEAPALTPETKASTPKPAPAPAAKQDKATPAPKAAPPSQSEEEAELVLAPGSFSSDGASCTYVTKNSKTYTWKRESSVVMQCDKKGVLVVTEELLSNLTFRLSAAENVIIFEYVFKGKPMSAAGSPHRDHCVQQVTQSVVEKFGVWLKSVNLPFEVGSQEDAQKEAAAKMLKKAQESLAQLGEDFKNAVLEAHNKVRCGKDGDILNSHSREGVPALTWSDACYIQAKIHADACSLNDKLELGCPDGYGQNLWKRGSGEPHLDPDFVTDMWALGESKYNFEKPGPQDQTRSFAQVVWKGTTSVGMAKSDCGQFMVANYFPGGPLFQKEVADYQDNVVPKTFEVPGDHPEFDRQGDTLDPGGCMAAATLVGADGNVKMQ